MKKIYVLFLLLLLPSPANADGEITTHQELCKNLQRHNPEGVDYVAGVDVHGKAVAPADLNSGGAGILDPIILPIDINLAERYGLALPAGAELKPTIANIKIFQNGDIEYNGVNISKKIYTACENLPQSEAEEAKTNGHKDGNAVVSSDKIDGQYPEKTSDQKLNE
jgi:hypothetical protein